MQAQPRRLAAIVTSVALAAGGVLLAQPAWADRPHREAVVVAAGQRLVEEASQGHYEQALHDADAMRRPDDVVLAQQLQKQQKVLDKKSKRYGGPGRVLSANVLDYAGCVTREFPIIYPNTTAVWTLKFRRNRDGYYLSDLQIHA